MPLGELLHAGDPVRVLSTEDDWVALVRAIGAGDARALQCLYERAHTVVFTLVFRIVRDRDIAEEMTVDAFQDVWRHASRYDAASGTVLGWVMSFARSRALACTRASEALPAIAEQRRFLRLVFSVLTFAERRAVEVAFFAGRNYEEAAVSLDESPAKVRQRLRVAMQKLRRVLAERPSGQ